MENEQTHQLVLGVNPEKLFDIRRIGYRLLSRFYAQKQLLLSARLSHRNSLWLSVCPSYG